MLFSVHKIFYERNKKIRKVGSVQCLVAKYITFGRIVTNYEKKVPQQLLFSRKKINPQHVNREQTRLENK